MKYKAGAKERRERRVKRINDNRRKEAERKHTEYVKSKLSTDYIKNEYSYVEVTIAEVKAENKQVELLNARKASENRLQAELREYVQNVHNFESLVDFLRDTLNWPIPDEGLEFDDITYDWSAIDLELDPDTQARFIRGRQLRLFDLKFDLSAVTREFDANRQAPWGIFFIEFNDDVELDACRTLLRPVLRGLVDRPTRSASLPSWDYDKILFICTTTNFQNIGFACFRGKKSRPIVDDYLPLRHFKLDG